MQKYVNFHYSVSVDLFGQEISTNAANYFTAGLKGRYLESRIDDGPPPERRPLAGAYRPRRAHCRGADERPERGQRAPAR